MYLFTLFHIYCNLSNQLLFVLALHIPLNVMRGDMIVSMSTKQEESHLLQREDSLSYYSIRVGIDGLEPEESSLYLLSETP